MCSGGSMAPTSFVPGPLKRLRHMVQWQRDGAYRLRAYGCKSNRGTTCRGGFMAPTNCVPVPRNRLGTGCSGGMTAPTNCMPGGSGSSRGTTCSGGPVRRRGPSSCVSGLRRRPGHMVQWRPVGVDRLRARAAEANGARGAVAA
eukprot:jgi/Tetstr1/438845/TSEL_027354.t1